MQSGFQEVIDHMASKPLRVATACSGTESPLLALEMVQRCRLIAARCSCAEDADLTRFEAEI